MLQSATPCLTIFKTLTDRVPMVIQVIHRGRMLGLVGIANFWLDTMANVNGFTMSDIPILKSKYDGMTFEEIMRESSIDVMMDVHIATYKYMLGDLTPEQEQVEREQMRHAMGVLYDTDDDKAAIDALHESGQA